MSSPITQAGLSDLPFPVGDAVGNRASHSGVSRAWGGPSLARFPFLRSGHAQLVIDLAVAGWISFIKPPAWGPFATGVSRLP